MLRCVIFDLDNTLIDSPLDFAKIKAEIGTEEPILEYRETVDDAEKRRIDEILDRHESLAAKGSAMLDGAHELLGVLRERSVLTALLTRNSRKSVDTIIGRHALRFNAVLSREDAPPKPSPEPVFVICRDLGVEPAECLMVGDFLFDIQSGQAAGARTLLMDGPHRHRFEVDADFEAASLHDAQASILSLLDKDR